jgi:hypothetical protein
MRKQGGQLAVASGKQQVPLQHGGCSCCCFQSPTGASAGIVLHCAVQIQLPLRRLPYAEAMAKYGSDKPDLRYSWLSWHHGNCLPPC